jgi:hypothetical protein
MEEDRMGVASVGPPDDDEVRLFDLLVGTRSSSQAKDRRQTDDARGMSGAVTAIDVVASHDHARKLLGEEVEFIRGLRTAKDSKSLRAVVFNGPAETLRRAVKRFLPGGWTKTVLIPDERCRQSRFVSLSRHPKSLASLEESKPYL